jgi:hypothetical protein
MPNTLPIWVAYLQALSTPAIAFAGIIVALGQLRVARNRFSYDIYDRRLKVYDAARDYLFELIEQGGTARDGTNPLNRLGLFSKDISESVFMFRHDVVDFLTGIKTIGYDYWRLNIRFSRLNESSKQDDTEFEACKAEEQRLLSLLEDKQSKLIGSFKPYLAPQA